MPRSLRSASAVPSVATSSVALFESCAVEELEERLPFSKKGHFYIEINITLDGDIWSR